jgi:tetratricopeptide (TPR) repeat protein
MKTASLLFAVTLVTFGHALAHGPDEDVPSPLPETAALSLLKMLDDSRIEDAAKAARGLDDDDPLTSYARASLAFHQGDYSAALEALPEPTEQPDIERKIAYLRRNIEGAVRATDGMLERVEGNFKVRFAPTADAILVDYALDALEGQRTYMARLLGQVPPGPTLVEFMPDVEAFLAASGLPPEWVETTNTVAISKWDRLIVLSPMNMSRGYPWKDTLAHEYVHYSLSRASHDRLPVWFQEGSAKVLEGRWHNPSGGDHLDLRSETLLARAIDQGTLIPFADMHPSMAALPSSQDAALAFAEVATAVDFLLKKAKPEGYRAVVDDTRKHGDVMRAILTEMGPAPGGFEGNWKRHLNTLRLEERSEIADLRQTISVGAAGAEDDGKSSMDEVLKQDDAMQDHARVGDLLRSRSRMGAALIEYRRAASTGRFHSPELANKMARTLHAMRRVDEAREVLRESVSLYPEYTPTVSLLARLAHEAGDSFEVVRRGQRAVGLNPFDQDVHHVLLLAHRAMGDEAAAAHEERVLQVLADHLGHRMRRMRPITPTQPPRDTPAAEETLAE